MATQPQTQSDSVSVADANEHAVVLAMAVAAIGAGGVVVALAAVMAADLVTLAATVPTSGLPPELEVGLAGLGLMSLGAVVYVQEWLSFPGR